MVINMIVVFGLNFITGLTGQMIMGSAGIYAIGAYTSALLSKNLGLSPWLTIAVAICAGFFLGRGLGFPSLKMKGVFLSLTTLAYFHVLAVYSHCLFQMGKRVPGSKG